MENYTILMDRWKASNSTLILGNFRKLGIPKWLQVPFQGQRDLTAVLQENGASREKHVMDNLLFV